jgi:hypothetical protein
MLSKLRASIPQFVGKLVGAHKSTDTWRFMIRNDDAIRDLPLVISSSGKQSEIIKTLINFNNTQKGPGGAPATSATATGT